MWNRRFAGDESLRNNPSHSGKIDAGAFAGFDYRSRSRLRLVQRVSLPRPVLLLSHPLVEARFLPPLLRLEPASPFPLAASFPIQSSFLLSVRLSSSALLLFFLGEPLLLRHR